MRLRGRRRLGERGADVAVEWVVMPLLILLLVLLLVLLLLLMLLPTCIRMAMHEI